jgi:DNA anti-recombination protein RmuC
MGSKLTPEFLQAELEVIGRLETKIAAELGSLRDEVRALSAKVEDSSKRCDKLVDKLIEMAMVQQGAFREAVGKSRSVALDPASQRAQDPEDDWREEEEWPPKGCDVMNV